jgi:hypothetical protein
MKGDRGCCIGSISDYVSWPHVMAATYGTLPSNEVGWGDSGSTFGEGEFEVPAEE